MSGSDPAIERREGWFARLGSGCWTGLTDQAKAERGASTAFSGTAFLGTAFLGTLGLSEVHLAIVPQQEPSLRGV